MELISAQRCHMAAFHRLYRTAFPRCERQPWLFLRWQHRKKRVQLLVAADASGALSGLAVMVPQGDLVLLNYLAVAARARGTGVGSRMLAALLARYPGRRMLLEIETPDPAAENNAQRLRRKAFYLRGGFGDSGVRIRIGGNRMTLLSNGPISYEDYCRIQRAALGPAMWQRLHVCCLSDAG